MFITLNPTQNFKNSSLLQHKQKKIVLCNKTYAGHHSISHIQVVYIVARSDKEEIQIMQLVIWAKFKQLTNNLLSCSYKNNWGCFT